MTYTFVNLILRTFQVLAENWLALAQTLAHKVYQCSHYFDRTDQLLKCSFICSSSKVKVLAPTKSENGHAHMLASARTYPISVATPYVPCESVSTQKLLKVDLTRTDAFLAIQLICSCTCYFTEMARKEFRPELAWHKQTGCSAG